MRDAGEFIALVPLTQGHVAIIDAVDAPRVFKHKWHAKVTKRGVVYAGTNLRRGDGSYRWQAMHRFILDAKSGEEIDHEDGDGLHNRRGNLRPCTHKQNMANRRAYGVSEYLGVSYRPNGTWQANCCGTHLGTFSTEVRAAVAYDAAAERVHGPFARLNFGWVK